MKIFFRTTSHQAGKHRPDWFSYEACFKNMLKTVRKDKDELIVFFDGDPETVQEYIKEEDGTRIEFAKDGGSETRSFRSLLEYIKEENLNQDEIVYIVEDDYLHRSSCIEALEDVLTNTNVDYATLYDHADKYFPNYFEKFAVGFNTFLFHTEKSHWRTTPSTTNTFATKYKTLMNDFDTHMKFSDVDEKVSRDHEKFHALWSNGRTLVSSIPGLSTHVENMLMSPCFDWSKSLSKGESSLSKGESPLSVDVLDDTVTEARA